MTGFININKAVGLSSAKDVSIIKRISSTPCGHMGTLDPMADGVLPIAIGNAARLFDYFLAKRKVYVAEFMFGVDSDTLDTTGEVQLDRGYVPTNEQIEEVLHEFCGEILQVPPKYSAKNIDGKRGYQLARQGVEFELPPKKVCIYSVELLAKTGDNTYSFKIECGGGTYIRSIARDLGARLQTCAIMSKLTRTQSGPFLIENAVSTQNLTLQNLQNYLIPTDSVLPFESFYPNEWQAKKLFNGLPISVDLTEGTYKIYSLNGSFYGLGEVKNSKLKIRVKLC